jgi:prolyl-tRNA synthetase
MDLIGIPHRLVIGERGLDKGIVEYRARADGEQSEIAINDLVSRVKKIVG